MIKCYSCGKYGHYAAECYNKKRDEEANLTLMQDQELALMWPRRCPTLSCSMKKILWRTFSQKEKTEWRPTCGTLSNHMTRDRTKFKEFDEKLPENMKFGDGSAVPIQGKGSILFQCKNGDQRLLKKVYYIPNLKSNIINLSQMTEDGSRVELAGSFLKMFDKNGTLLMKVKQSHNRLYRILLETSQSTSLLMKLVDPTWR